jgi:hypothetical protein
MMTNNDVCLFEFVGEVEKNQHTNITSNVFALYVLQLQRACQMFKTYMYTL